MWTGHLSRFMPGKPPGPKAQEINALLHQEPYATISYTLFWSFFLLFIPPLAGITLLWIFVYEMIRWFKWPRRRIEPKKMLSTNNNNNSSSSNSSIELAIVVTGCDSGFGKELVFRLAAEGFVVFAGCLHQESFAQFTGEPSLIIKPLLMDVTKQSQIDSAYETVKQWLGNDSDDNSNNNNNNNNTGKKKRYFHALINNAGVGKSGYIDWCKMSFYEICMEVNCFAQIRTTKTFLPILKQQAIDMTYSHSQIVNMVSMAGMNAGNGLALNPYEVSKAAAEAFTEGLRLEMKMFGIKVISVNPSFHTTPLVDQVSIEKKAREELWEQMSPQMKEEYGQEFFELYLKHTKTSIASATWDFKVVVDSIVDAIQSTEPPSQLIIGSDSKFFIIPMRMLPSRYRHFIVQALIPPQVPAALKNGKKSLKS